MQPILVMPRIVAAVSTCAYQAHQALAALERSGLDGDSVDAVLQWAIDASRAGRCHEVAGIESRLKWALYMVQRGATLPFDLELWYRISTRTGADLAAQEESHAN